MRHVWKVFGLLLPAAIAAAALVPYGAHADGSHVRVETHAQVVGATRVAIDINPGHLVSGISSGCTGTTPIAILTTPDFDAATIDVSTVTFEGASSSHWAVVDVDGDRDTDLVPYFSCQETEIASDAAEACLQGFTFDGARIEGCDSVPDAPPRSFATSASVVSGTGRASTSTQPAISASPQTAISAAPGSRIPWPTGTGPKAVTAVGGGITLGMTMSLGWLALRRVGGREDD